ncbi:relaxase/mobilization nuclease domain-containing protein [Sphingomonas glaciei]|uniref:Relaxase/mobilization nuclease domain-containing protein n=1 Tax=Sphingomonas glaciei TaxID=2938948 RepID=A0ABY5MQE6_9SPHN|nr:relaxase/mobilization nuclease domain-containing protein [Sphingomonas glaciei]UUR06740.1 relaxase/mobilization nuclease domain-containing protein [Sphingomonas glaciei]
MIGKIIRMNRHQRPSTEQRVARLQSSVLALTRYVVDADPHALAAVAAENVLSITDYALAVRHAGIEPGEKVEASGKLNLLGRDLAEWQAEMLATAVGATTVKNHVVHIILSLHEGETWSPQQREEAITIMLGILRLERCQTIWAEHSNTRNPHLHLAVLRVDPTTGSAAGTDWLIDDLHQGLALIEERQDRIREPNALYRAEEGAIFDVETGALVRDADGTFVSKWWEATGKKRTRLPSLIRDARGALVQAAAEASSWADLHERLKALDATYDKAGSGARIAVETQSAKASEVHSSLSRPELEKRLGLFERDLTRLNTGFEAYRVSVQDQLDHLRQKRDEEVDAVDAWVKARVAEMPGDKRKMLAPLVQQEGAAATKAIQKAFAEAISRGTRQRMNEDQWRQSGEPAMLTPVSSPSLILPLSGGEEFSTQLADRSGRKAHRYHTDYLDRDGRTLFADHRAFIIIHAADEVAAVDEALALAAERWGTLRLTGSAAFIALAAQRAEALGISVIYDAEAPAPQSPDTQVDARTKSNAEAEVVSVPAPRQRSPEEMRALQVRRALKTLDDLPDLRVCRRAAAGDNQLTGRTGPFQIVADRYDPRLEEVTILDLDPLVQKYLQQRQQKRIDDWAVELERRCDGPLPYGDAEILAVLSPVGNDRALAEVASRDAEFLEMTRRVREKLKDRPVKKKLETPSLVNSREDDLSYEEVRRLQAQLAQIAAQGR